MDASYKIQRGIHVHLIQFFMCPEFWVHITMGELRQLNEQNKLAIWAERVTECRNSGQSVLAWCKEHGICSQTYYKWQKRLFSVGKTAIVNVDPPPSPLQRKQGRPEILLTGPHLFPRIFFPASAV